MPLNKSIRKVLVIGSGPIVIGQAAEFDYAGTQACRALREDGIEIVLVNSNPATIMTDKAIADKIYIEPLTLTTVKRIIEIEKPDSILSGLGGQTGLTLSMELDKCGFLKSHNVRLLGASRETIDKAEDRQIFKDTMESIGEPCIPSEVVTNVKDALSFASKIGYPVIVRPAFTLGGTGGGICKNERELKETASSGLSLSPINQVLIERCVSGWKEIEFEVIRDSENNTVAVCSMENFDPVGIHTGDSIVIAPAVTLADKELQMLRSAALKIIETLGVEGGCNVQFALNPDSFEYAVIEVNPRVSRSSALASKATGYPIAKVATKIALGYRLDEIKNAVTGKTYASFEPAIDYVAVKFPKWPFDKFVYAKRELGTQMKATGEVMSISDSFESAIMKAVRGAEISHDTLNDTVFAKYSKSKLIKELGNQTDERIFVIFEALKKGVSIDEIYKITRIDRWFLSHLLNIVEYQNLISESFDKDKYIQGKKLGFTDASLKQLCGKDFDYSMKPNYKMVDTCAGEFSAETPYFYSTYNTAEEGGENEAEIYGKSKKKKIIVIGSGPIRIGQGIEFDYASVHCVWALKELGYEVVIINNNPETVSTDFDTGDRLYFEPLGIEDVMNIIGVEKPDGVIVAFGGQTAIKLTGKLNKSGINILGTSADSIDMAEDRERFDKLLESLSVKRPAGFTVMTTDEALDAAHKLGYPVLMRPSYVLGGQNMIIAFGDDDIKEYMAIILRTKQDNPILIDKYLSGREIEVDAIYDGERVLIPGIMEHIERTGIHSGDSIAIYPAQHIDDDMSDKIVETTRALCRGLNSIGIANVQYILVDNDIYVIEVNPRASRTVPYLSKVTGVPMVDIATRVSMGEKLKDMGYNDGVYHTSPYIAAKVPVFSFEKLTDVDVHLGPEMKSTGEVLGIGRDIREAVFKGLLAAGYKMTRKGGVFITVRDSDKTEIAEVAKKFDKLGFTIYATEGTADFIERLSIKTKRVKKIHQSGNNAIKLFESGKINYIISTSAKGRDPARDSVKIRRKALLLGIPCLTSIDTSNALADALMTRYSEFNTELVDINNLRSVKKKLPFVKMEASGNDYIYIDCMDNDLTSPESLAVALSDRHYGVGGDGIVLILKSKIADAAMRTFNLDGSEGLMGGNGLRCVAKYLYDNGIINKKHISIETKSGIKNIDIVTQNKKVISAVVDMNSPEFDPKRIPVKLKSGKILNRDIHIEGEKFTVSCVSMGNPHCVIFCDEPDNIDLERIGPMIENCTDIFPERVNVEFVSFRDKRTLKMRVWERGIGETWACGTGACAGAVIACELGLCDKDEFIRVILPGGDLNVKYQSSGEVFLQGNAAKVFEGVVEV